MFKKNLFLIIVSILFSLILIEIFFYINGRYSHLTKNNLKPSSAIYERSFSSKQNHKHPDLDYIIENYFDEDGVKNFEKIITSKKKNIIGIFGDSFTENIAVDREFEYAYLLNQETDEYNIVNYGTGGYSADQVFLRYLKYTDHDIKHVFFLLMPGDQGFSTKSEFKDSGEYKIHDPDLNYFYLLMGKLNLTYLLIDTYYFFKSNIKKNFTETNIDNYNQILANKIYQKFYNRDLDKCNDKDFSKDICAKNLLNLLRIFKNEAKKNQAEFHILLYPNDKHISYFKKVIEKERNKFNYYILDRNLESGSIIDGKRINFQNDAHWNEFGNLFFAINLQNIFDKIGIKTNSLNKSIMIKKIEKFYEKQNDE